MPLSILLTLTVLSTGAPVEVDPGVKEVSTCRITAVAFRTASDGWMFDDCGAVFRTRDGGEAWHPVPEVQQQFFGGKNGLQHIQRALWLSSSTGLAFVHNAPKVFRTDDGGRTWTSAVLPEGGERLYAVEAVGRRVWYCGSSGRVRRSDDAGRTWIAGQKLFHREGPGWEKPCSGLSFLDARDGWASGQQSLWQSRDGGVTWTGMTPILPPPEDIISADDVLGLVRLTPQVAWAKTRGGARLRTLDGGGSWKQVAATGDRPGAVRRHDGRLVVVVGWQEAIRIEDVVPMVDERWVPVADAGAMDFTPRSFPLNFSRGLGPLTSYRRGELVRRGPPVSAPAGEVATLQGRADFGDVGWGWADATVFRTDDAGRSWRHIGSLPAPVTRLAAANGAQVLARAGSDLYRSDSGGRSWHKADDVAVRREWGLLTGEKGFEPPGDRVPACALRGPARLVLEYGAKGCYGTTSRALTVTVSAGGTALMEGSFEEWDPDLKQRVPRRVERRLSREETSRTVRRISAAVTRLERPSGCQSTAETFAKLQWTCGKGPQLMLDVATRDCGRAMTEGVGSETRWGIGGDPGYSVAAELYAIGSELLSTASPDE